MRENDSLKFLLTSFIVFLAALFVTPNLFAASSDISNWDAERYGDRIDIDAKLNKLSKNENFIRQTEQNLKKQAKKLPLSEKNATKQTASDANFSYDGGTKYFLNRNLSLKTYTLRSVGENVEIWVADDLSFPEGDTRPDHVVTQPQVDKLRDEFDSNIYPKDTAFFGMPDTLDGSNAPLPEMVGLPEDYYEGSDKVIILVDNIQDDNYEDPEYPFFVAGFFWQTIENYIDRNIVTIDSSNWDTRLESTFFATTIHELQHLIHADNDGAEESWLNEGMSTFSEYLGGYGHDAGSINFYLDHPENSLVNWDEHVSAETGPETIADYGQVYLFTLFMNEQFGQEFIRDLAKNTSQGLSSVNEVLKEYGSKKNFTDVYQDFITTLAIDDDKYNFKSIDLRNLPVDDEGTPRGITVDYEKALTYEKDGVPAWGGDFKTLDFDEKIDTIHFDGIDFRSTPWTSVNDPLGSGEKVLWGGKADEADNELVFEADLTSLSNATLQFDHFIDIEEQWDFGVVQVSTDGGETWESLANENTRSDVVEEGYPKIKENVPGFTGHFENWQQESFDLSNYSGQEILISFRYLTDWGTTNDGWYIDNIAIQEIDYYQDGSSTEPFTSFQELTETYVNYTVTFINERELKHKTKYKVITVDPFNVTDENALQLRQLFKKGTNRMITSYAAPADDKNPVPFTYEVELKKKGR
ncbi:immune inhibitor A domain-containing protein [Gracilibacillus salinarum]|uniref:Immune inhibitor A n=1 Tax=Gracilibacillus salinarum TaxID=2932255 RepID=A0ABY4GR86_9BACI|nr:immune inhibitor A domain-containing protein [Gracilibacillus salinarum]UOQ86480.1 immune inhibitor A [Gracilibacillus salinarum]